MEVCVEDISKIRLSSEDPGPKGRKNEIWIHPETEKAYVSDGEHWIHHNEFEEIIAQLVRNRL
jgi:hypothetical protein